MTRKDRTLSELADFARLVVRAGYLNRAHAQVEVGNFVRAELDDDSEADDLTQRLVSEAEAELAQDQAGWPERTDNDVLRDVFAELGERGFLVLEYCQDHFDASAELCARPGAIGIVFFTETDVWHAITENMLELKVWHADTSNVVSADPELAVVLESLRRHGLPALFDEGRIEVTMTWRKRELF
ncbi:MAG: hypothetical protein ABWX96_09020 [Propionibacteriaceae bacterium]